jgi:hypothetical protein
MKELLPTITDYARVIKCISKAISDNRWSDKQLSRIQKGEVQSILANIYFGNILIENLLELKNQGIDCKISEYIDDVVNYPHLKVRVSWIPMVPTY